MSSTWQAMFEEAMLSGEKRKRATKFSSLTRGKRQRDILPFEEGRARKRFLMPSMLSMLKASPEEHTMFHLQLVEALRIISCKEHDHHAPFYSIRGGK